MAQYEPLDDAEIVAIEAKIDAAFEATPLPKNDLNGARWIMCLFYEDQVRFGLERVANSYSRPEARAERGAFVHGLDHGKYALRQALALCTRSAKSGEGVGPVQSDPDSYIRAAELFEASGQFADATRLLSSYHGGSTRFVRDSGSGAIRPLRDMRATQYSALEALIGADRDEFNPIGYVVSLFSSPRIAPKGLWLEPSQEIVSHTRVDGRGRVRYQFIEAFARPLFDAFNEEPAWPGPHWRYPWATSTEAQKYFAALQALSLYHLISIHYGAARKGLPGIGVDQICLHANAETLNQEIARLSGLNADVTAATTDALTYGATTETPDPALQPLIPIGGRGLAVPGALIWSSDWSRNMLSLHARVDQRSFNSESSAFERIMLDRLSADLGNRYRQFRSVFLPTLSGDEEVDLVCVNEASGHILLLELRWMLQPGDVREVLNRKKVIAEKVQQAERKVTALRANLPKVVRHLGLPTGTWTVEAAVIIEGFGGAASAAPKSIPVVPRDVFVAVLQDAPSLEWAHAFLCTPLWLPRSGSDFRAEWRAMTFLGVAFEGPTFEFGDDSYLRKSLSTYVRESSHLSVDALRATPWFE